MSHVCTITRRRKKKKTDTNLQDIVSCNTKGGEYVGNISKKTVDNAKELGYASWQEEKMNLTNTCKLVIVLALSWLVITAVTYSCRSHAAEPVNYLEAHMDRFFSTVNPKRLERAKKLLPAVYATADKYNLDPLLIGMTISWESSWKTGARGKDGEFGIGQLMVKHNPGVDHRTAEGQIDGVGKRLRKGRDQCGNILEAINEYMTGHCRPLVTAAQYRYQRYLKQGGIGQAR